MTLSVESFPLAQLGPDALAAWQDLAIGAGDAGNPFLEPWFLHTALAQFDGDGHARLMVARDGDGVWHGLMVVAPSLWLGRLPFSGYRGWQHTQQFVGTPLLRRGSEESCWQAFLVSLDASPVSRIGLTLPNAPADDPGVVALRALCKRTARPLNIVYRQARAALSLADLRDEGLTPKRAARLRVLGERLRGTHDVTFDTLDTGSNPDRWIDEFLDLERSGWKGEAGSALACDPRTEAVFRAAMRDGHAAGKVRGHALRVDGRAIAMTTYFVSGRRAYGFKACYDEAFAGFAPGLLLLRNVMALLDRPIAFDSCATPDNRALHEMWRDRREILELCVSIGRRRRLFYGVAMAANRAWALLKRMRPRAA